MTFRQKYKENQKLMQAYDSFLPEVDNYDDRLRLMTEIGRLHKQNKEIEQMPFSEVKNDILEYNIEVKSTL